LKGSFEQLKVFVLKLRYREKKKVGKANDAKSEVRWLHALLMHAGDAEEIPTPPQNLVFGHQTTPQAPPPKAHALDACTVHINNCFL